MRTQKENTYNAYKLFKWDNIVFTFILYINNKCCYEDFSCILSCVFLNNEEHVCIKIYLSFYSRKGHTVCC